MHTLTADWASDNAENLLRLTGSSTHVFIGEVLDLDDVRFEQLSPGRESTSEVPVSIFNVSVETEFKGEFDDSGTVIVEQLGGFVEEDGGEVLVVLEGDEPLEIGQTYLFFSIEKNNGTLNTPPFGRFIMESDGTVLSLSEWKELSLSRQLEGLSPDKLRDEIELAVEGNGPRISKLVTLERVSTSVQRAIVTEVPQGGPS